MKKEKHNKYTESRMSNYKMYIKTYGLLYVMRYGLHKSFPGAMHWIFKNFVKFSTFEFDNNELDVFFNKYRTTWANERMIEIPLFHYLVEKYCDKRILEVGNVLPHYFDVNHDVLDKYEQGENVINEDIAQYKPEINYDIIISISTFEHIGYDEDQLRPEKIFEVIEHLKNMLNPNGKIIFSIPIAYNPYLDEFIFHNRINLNDEQYYTRKRKFNKWEKTDRQTAADSDYGNPYYCASTILIGTIKKND